MGWPERILAAGAFTAFFGGYLFMKGPAVNNAQSAFRLGLLASGAVLLIVGSVLKAKGGKGR